MARTKTTSSLEKSPTGIRGLDDITGGGLPAGRPTLVCGQAGSGKTILGMEFVARGAMQYGEPGVFVAFEETPEELTENFRSIGFDLDKLQARKHLVVDYVYVERSEIEETGSYSLDGLFIRLGDAIDSIGAKRVVLDSLEVLFSGLKDTEVLRAELRRLFRWLKTKGVTAIITGERGEGELTRYGLEEYVADCVIFVDVRVKDQIATRRLRVVKYRGTRHGIDEFPFLIDDQGVSIFPLTSLTLAHGADAGRVTSGIPRLDSMLGGKGYFRGSTVLVSGTAGSGKSSLAASFAAATCSRGARCLYFAFEESPAQIKRNMGSIGIKLEPFEKRGLLQFHASRPSLHGLEMHLVAIHKAVTEHRPAVIVIDPISNLISVGTVAEVKSMLTRLIDFFKMSGITVLFTDLVQNGRGIESTNEEVSSLIDTWILLRDIETGGERNRLLSIIKSRGMAHSNQVREFLLTRRGIELLDVYLGAGAILTGSARAAKEADERAEQIAKKLRRDREGRNRAREQRGLERQISELREEFKAQEAEEQALRSEEEAIAKSVARSRLDLAKIRRAD